MIEQLKSYFPDFDYIEESALSSRSTVLGWQVTAKDTSGTPMGSGFAKDLTSARKIAIAEFIERKFVQRCRKSGEKNEWLLDIYPTSCGFAAGFDLANTKFRSTCEAIERWALSQWFDFNCPLEKYDQPFWSIESAPLRAQFENIKVFKKSFARLTDGPLQTFELCLLFGFSEKGAFMGCAVRNSLSQALEHALIEAHRHLLIAAQDRNFNLFPFNRIRFFAENKMAALAVLEVEKRGIWPAPEVHFQKAYQNHLFTICRTIYKDWIPWELGPENRLLY